MDRAFGPRDGSATRRPSSKQGKYKYCGLRFLKAHKGGVAKNGDVDAMTRLLGGISDVRPPRPRGGDLPGLRRAICTTRRCQLCLSTGERRGRAPDSFGS